MTDHEHGIEAVKNILLLRAHELSAQELAEAAISAYLSALSTPPQPEEQGDKKVEARDAADAYIAEKGFEHSGGIIERAFEAGARWATLRPLPEGFRRQEIEDMLSIVQDEPQTVDGGGEYGPQESTDGWYTRLLREILKKSEGA